LKLHPGILMHMPIYVVCLDMLVSSVMCTYVLYSAFRLPVTNPIGEREKR
jgi:hypothetical protein